LGQTELFAHFLKLKDVKDDAMKAVLAEKELVKDNKEG
jgi:SWI/SNF-related matrix-associated actin-dependent regulator of chromatin subfamily A member 5